MLSQETLNKLKYMKMAGMVEALEQQEADSAYQEMSFQDRLGLAVDREFSRRQHSRLQRLIRAAKFQNATACVEDIFYGDDRKLDSRTLGKSYLSQALGQAACRRYLSTRYAQFPDLLDELKMARIKSLEAFRRLRKQLVCIR